MDTAQVPQLILLGSFPCRLLDTALWHGGFVRVHQTDHDGGLGTAHVIKVPEGRYLSPNVLIAAVAEATDVDHSLHFCASHDHRWNYVHEGVDDHPDYIANLNVPGESKPGATQGEGIS